ncbi:hypothetical protein FGB62_88g014 [Gracilaria domingensis]|nr:hypothetical protein FGB62_88g014 [Gracilaria domingensis]
MVTSYTRNILPSQYSLFSAAALLGITVGAVEDFYKRYSCSRPRFIIVYGVTWILTLSFALLIVAQGMFLFTRDHPNPGERTVGIVMMIFSAVLAMFIVTIMPFVNKTLLRVSLLTNLGIVPGMMVYLLIITGGSFSHLKDMLDGLVLYVSYTYPILILTELFVLALISRQREENGMKETSGESGRIGEDLVHV